MYMYLIGRRDPWQGSLPTNAPSSPLIAEGTPQTYLNPVCVCLPVHAMMHIIIIDGPGFDEPEISSSIALHTLTIAFVVSGPCGPIQICPCSILPVSCQLINY